MTSSTQRWIRTGLLLAVVTLPAVLLSADFGIKNLRKPNPDDRTVDMFAAIEAKEIEVKLIPKDDTESRVLIKNNTAQPLNVKLPAAFAGVPVLAQIANAGGGRGGGNSTQSMGGGMGMGMMGGRGMGMGMMSVPPEQVGQFKVPTVCLEHGKKEPRPSVPYQIKPLAQVTSKPGVEELLTALGTGKLPQRAAQAAAWHLANDMSWQQLAAKRIVHLNGTSEPWFSPQEIQAGMQLARASLAQAQEKQLERAGQSGSQNEPVESFDRRIER